MLTYTDSNKRTNKQKKQIGSEKEIQRRRTNVYIIRSDWLKMEVPLVADDSANHQPTTIDQGLYRVEYHQRSVIGAGVENTVTVYLDGIPKKIIDTALSHRGSRRWDYGVRKTSIHPNLKDGNKRVWVVDSNAWKCNQFVNNILTETDPTLTPPWLERGRFSMSLPGVSELGPPLARDWANSGKLTANWSFNTAPQSGDVASYEHQGSTSTGHCGFVIAYGVTISAGENKILVNDAGFRDSMPGQSLFNAFRRHKSVK